MKWNSIETFFLDMDGTILDLSYDNYFWHQHIPYVYAQKNNITFEKAKLEFERKYKKKKNTIQWYSLNFWSNELDINLDAELIKTKHKIRLFPGVLEFLDQLKKRKIKIIILTNCPRKMLNVKITQTKLWGYFSNIISSEDFGYAKETDEFWQFLEKEIFYNKDKAIFIDDSENVLKYSHKNGLKNIISINYPDSNREKQEIQGYHSLDGISLLEFEKKFID